MKRKKGFTLVELLATIVILSIILVIAVPKIVTVIDDAKKATLESSAKMVASEAEKRKVQNQVLGKDENITCENVSRLNDIDYENCYIEFLNNQAYVTIIGSNKFEDMFICKGTKNESKVVDRCPNERVSVTIDSAGGSVKDLSGIYKEGDVIELENPEKEHATFLNWNVVKGNSTLSDNKLTVGSEDTIVWAEYEEWGELIIDLDGGSVSNNQSGKYKSNTTIELEVPLKENHKFVEWEKIEGNGIVSGTTFTMGSLNTKIKAKWELNVFKLNVELNGGTISKDYSGDYEVGSTITIENPTKAGYTFDGWNISGSDASINDNVLTMGTEDTTITAKWIANIYTVKYECGNGTTGTPPASQTVKYGENITILSVADMCIKRGYTFSKWNDLTEVSWTGWSGKWTYIDGVYGIVNNVLILRASWIPNIYKIKYNANGGSGSIESHTVEYNDIVTIKSNTFTKTGYTFGGWTTKSNGTNDGNGWTNWSGKWTYIDGEYGISNKTLELYAIWTPNTYTISYTLNGGTKGSSAPTSGTYGSTVTVSNPTRSGYTFTGWSVSGTGASISGTTLTIGAGNITLTANWKVSNTIPAFTYTGTYEIVDDNDNKITTSTGNWKIRFLTSGTLKFTELRGAANGIDVFLVGGGASGFRRGGGGGGRTTTAKGVSVKVGSYEIVVGAGGAGGSSSSGSAGGKTTAFSKSASGGSAPDSDGYPAGSGGSGGGGRSDGGGNGGAGGSNGGSGEKTGGGSGQGTTTREFGESSGKLYAGGGGGGGSGSGSGGAGGAGGGGAGVRSNGSVGGSGQANTGGGGGGSDDSAVASKGGSGIVIIRNKR